MILVDTNVLGRLAGIQSPQRPIARQAVDRLAARNETLILFPQNVYEFWVIATRPITSNGFGFTTAQTLQWVDQFERSFTLLSDPPTLYSHWKSLMQSTPALGKPAHDARLVAAMQLHNIPTILTFNTGDFSRYSVTPLDPHNI